MREMGSAVCDKWGVRYASVKWGVRYARNGECGMRAMGSELWAIEVHWPNISISVFSCLSFSGLGT